jgi:hypothetical protein
MNGSAIDRVVLVSVMAANVALCCQAPPMRRGRRLTRSAPRSARPMSLAVDIAGPPTAIGNTHRFYRKTVRGAEQFVVVDADTQQRQPAFDHEKSRCRCRRRLAARSRRRRFRSTRSFTGRRRGVFGQR